MASTAANPRHFASMLLRALPPIAIIAAGWWGYTKFMEQIEIAPPAAKDERVLRTRVQSLQVIDYPTVIETNAVVQAHNRVTLTAEVTGVVTMVNPSFEVGAYFSKGEVLIEIDARDYRTALSMAESRHESSKSALKLARLIEERKLRLVSSNAVSQAEVDAASATREQAEADVAIAQTELDQATLNLERTRVLAPFDGRVQAKNIGVGQMANTNNPLGEVFAVDFAEVRLPVSAQQREFLELPEFADDPPVAVELRDGINPTNGHVWHANIVRTEGVLDQNSRDMFAIARIDDPFGRKSGEKPLRIGQPVVAAIKGIVIHDVVALPREAVRQLDQVVLVQQPGNTLLPITIDAIWTDAEYVVVDKSAIPDNVWLATTAMVYTPVGAKVEIIDEPSTVTSIADSKSNDNKNTAN